MDNMTLFYPTKSLNIFKISDKIKFLPVQSLPRKKIRIKQYQCKKTSKYQSQNKNYQLFTVEENDQIFFQLKQKTESGQTKSSVYTIAFEGFFQNNFAHSLFGDKKLKSVTEYQVSTLEWDGFTIEFIPFSQNNYLLLLTNQMILTFYKTLSLEEIRYKLRVGFEQIVKRLIYSDKKSEDLFQTIAKHIANYIEKHKQIVKQNAEGKQINFRLIRYAELIKLHSQVIGKVNSLERSNSSQQAMEIQQ